MLQLSMLTHVRRALAACSRLQLQARACTRVVLRPSIDETIVDS
jgi:hypothetical protein